MATNQLIRSAIAVLNLSPSFKKRGEQVQAIITACLSCELVSWPVSLLSDTQNALDAFIKAQAGMLTRATGTKAVRDSAWDNLYVYVVRIKNAIQDAADANPTMAPQIITGCNLLVKQGTPRQKQADAVRNGATSGTLILFGFILPFTKAHEWQMSDDTINWTMLPFTISSSTMVIGQTPTKKLYFRHRCVTKNGTEMWGDVMMIIVI